MDSERAAQGGIIGNRQARTPTILLCPPVRKLEARLPPGGASVWSCSRVARG